MRVHLRSALPVCCSALLVAAGAAGALAVSRTRSTTGSVRPAAAARSASRHCSRARVTTWRQFYARGDAAAERRRAGSTRPRASVHMPIADCDAQGCRRRAFPAGRRTTGETAMQVCRSADSWPAARRCCLARGSAAAPILASFGYAATARRLSFRSTPSIPRRARPHRASLGDLLHGKPAVLALVYFHCPNLCGVVRDDLFDALGKTGLTAGRDYTLIALSIDPAETAADAAAGEGGRPVALPAPGRATGLAFPDRLGRQRTGRRRRRRLSATASTRSSSSSCIPPALCSRRRPGSSRAICSASATRRRRALGVTRARAWAASRRAASPVLLLCFHFDPTTGRYTLAI